MEFSIVPVPKTDVDTLLKFSRKTFMEAFESQNTPEDIEIYDRQAFTRSFLFFWLFLVNSASTTDCALKYSEKIKSQLENPDSFFWFGKIGDEIVGYIKINFGKAQSEPQSEEWSELERIYVDRSHQGKKIGEKLLDFAVEESKRRAKKVVWLGVWDQNRDARRFYERKGFKQFDQHTFVLGTDKQIDIIYKKDL
eukprot:TRINITY_DN4158_c0_g1_i4.p1 TRINITY_DN4158_c0_g1~~TRINITY_DN4158_c0_g1_i4.p1  ORF type:complete len:195 (-),score=42.37 TRINITY_DN4158_c0_g1_i4:21-605(-)